MKPRSLLRAVALASFAILVSFRGASGVPDSSACGHISSPNPPATIPIIGTNRALFILAEFPDQTPVASPCGPNDPWPPGLINVPSWAQHLLDDGGSTTEGSLSHFFDKMSNGAHSLRGIVYPKMVSLTAGLQYYHGNIAEANVAVIQAVDADNSINFANFDSNEDDVVDFVFICYRQQYSQYGGLVPGRTGLSQLDFPNGAPVPVNADIGDPMVVASAQGAQLYPQAFKRGPGATRGVAIHEYVHDLLSYAAAQPNLAFPTNHITSVGHWGLMDGVDVNVGEGTLMETLLRWKLGWITPAFDIALAIGQKNVVELRDVGEYGQLGFGIVRTADPKQYFLLECRDSSATAYTDGSTLDDPTGCQGVEGFSGLLIQHISEHKRPPPYDDHYCCGSATFGVKGWWEEGEGVPPVAPLCPGEPCENECPFACCPNQAYPPTIDIEVATGMLSPTSWRPDPIRGMDGMSCESCEPDPSPSAQSDLFRPGQSTTFAPYTNPNTNLYWFSENPLEYDDPNNCSIRRDQSIYSGLSFYNMRWITQPGNGGAGEFAVTIRMDAAPPPTQPFAIQDDTRWDGKLQLMGDIEVASGKKLEIAQGSKVFAAADQDIFGADGESQILVSGALDVQGTVSKRVNLTSTRDSEFVHYLGNGENGALPSTSDWAGIKFIDAGDNGLSDMKYSDFENARHAVSLDSLSGTIFHCTFANSQTADLYLDGDTRIPAGREWNLDAPTTFKATPTSIGPDGLNAGKVDVVFDGALRTQRPSGGSGWVTFTSTTQNPANGDDWGGITVVPGGAAEVRDADLGYAITPIHFLGTNLASISDSRVHHYKDQGILDTSSKSTILRCKVERGTGFDPFNENSGIQLITSAGKVEADTVLWHPRYGISAEFSQTFCTSPPGASPETLFVRNNVVQGLGPTDPSSEGNPADTGINLSWICKHVVGIVESDSIRFWSRGASLYNCSDTRVECVGFWDNYIGLYYERNCGISAPPGEEKVVIELCKFKSNYQYGLKIVKPVGLELGGPYTYAPVGLNSHRVDPYTGPPVPSRFVNISNWTGPCYTPPANYELGQNVWFLSDGTLITVAADVTAKIDGTGASRVRVTPLLTAEQSCDQEGTLLSLGEERIEEGLNPISLSATGGGTPPEFAVRSFNSGPRRIRIHYDVPMGSTGPVSITIYDVAGRLVTGLKNLESDPGYHSTEWGGESDSGNPAAIGIYFVVLRAREVQATERLS